MVKELRVFLSKLGGYTLSKILCRSNFLSLNYITQKVAKKANQWGLLSD